MVICGCGTGMKHVGIVTVSSPTTGESFAAPIHECSSCGRQTVDLNPPKILGASIILDKSVPVGTIEIRQDGRSGVRAINISTD